MADGYCLAGEAEDELESPARLSLNFQPCFRLRTDEAKNDPYQVFMRLSRLHNFRNASVSIDMVESR